MFALAVVAVPIALLLFALAMERVESRLAHDVVAEEEVEEFLDQAKPSEVRALYGHGIGRALEMFRLRRLAGRADRGRPRREDSEAPGGAAATSASSGPRE
jgi:hypothetical protein